VSGVAADEIVGHERADDNAQGSEADERNGEGDLLYRLLVALRERRLHHYVLIGNRERVIHVHFSSPLSVCVLGYSDLAKVFPRLTIEMSVFIEFYFAFC